MCISSLQQRRLHALIALKSCDIPPELARHPLSDCLPTRRKRIRKGIRISLGHYSRRDQWTGDPSPSPSGPHRSDWVWAKISLVVFHARRAPAETQLKTRVVLSTHEGYIVGIERSNMTTLTVKCPDQLAERLGEFVKEGWSDDVGETVIEALRRFLDSHRPDIARMQALADVEWGLHGSE